MPLPINGSGSLRLVLSQHPQPFILARSCPPECVLVAPVKNNDIMLHADQSSRRGFHFSLRGKAFNGPNTPGW
jgi:hypothetical protein